MNKFDFVSFPNMKCEGFNPHLEAEGYKTFLMDEGRIIAYGYLTKWPEFPIPTVGIWVKDTLRGYGLGKKILKHLIEKASDEYPAVRLSVLKTNAVAIHIYKEAGFKTTEEAENVYWMQLDFDKK